MIRSLLSLVVVAGLLGGTASAQKEEGISYVGAFKTAFYYQKSATETVPEGGRPYTFEVRSADLMHSEIFPSLNVVGPNTGKVNATFFPYSKEPLLTFTSSFISLGSFNLSYPFGTYTARAQFTDGDQVVLNLPIKSQKYPLVPKVTNLVSAQTIDPAKAFTLKWAPFKDAGSGDLITVQAFRVEPEAPSSLSPVLYSWDYLTSGFFQKPLSAKATSLVIPANTLDQGAKYYVELTFVHVDLRSISTSPEKISRGSGVASKIKFFIKTTGSSGSMP